MIRVETSPRYDVLADDDTGYEGLGLSDADGTENQDGVSDEGK